MVELEARFEVQGRPVLVVGWFEGSGTGRIVVNGPNRLREEVQVSLEISLSSEVEQAMAEAPPTARQGAPLKVHFTVVTDQGRITRSIELGGSGTKLDALCLKLLTMAEMMVRGDGLKKIVGAVKARATPP